MTSSRLFPLSILVAFVAAVGCVDRRFVVETNVPGAQVTVDGVPIGPSPADAEWEYAGNKRFRAVAPGYEPLDQVVNFRPKWYNYPPFDFFAEVLWPLRIEDVRRVRLTLQPRQPVNRDALLQSADQLRVRGNSLPPASVPAKLEPVNSTDQPSPTNNIQLPFGGLTPPSGSTPGLGFPDPTQGGINPPGGAFPAPPSIVSPFQGGSTFPQ